MLDRVANNLKKVVSPISQVLGYISMAVIVLVVLLVVADVLLRRFADSPIQGSHDITALAFSIIVFLPLAWLAMNDGHVEMDFIVKKFPKIAQSILEVIMIFITTTIIGLMSWQVVVQGTKLQAANQETAILGIPMYPFLYLAAVGGFILAMAFFIRFLYSLSNIIEKRR